MFVRQPELLVFDDLSSALDVNTERALWSRLRGEERRAKGEISSRHSPLATRHSTFLVVSHRREALRRADRIVLLVDGRIASTGTLADLLATNEEIQRLWQGDAG